MKCSWFCGVAAGIIVMLLPSRAAASETMQIGQINFFGYAGLNLTEVRAHLPIHVEESISYAALELTKSAINRNVQAVTGKPSTGITAVCCDSAGRLLVYIGLPGASARALVPTPPPKGRVRLDAVGKTLYARQAVALETAVRRGNSGEDRSLGYALSHDPDLRLIQLSMRDYAVVCAPQLEDVLTHSAIARDRAASAWLLGYANRSPAQIQTLARAAADEDPEVRNNAVRALAVLASVPTGPPLPLDPQPFIRMLFSNDWLDRNKSSLFLERVTQPRSRPLLANLRRNALLPLIEGASWSSPGHSTPFLLILGRIAQIPEPELQALIDAGHKEQIIQAAVRNPAETRSSPR